MLNDPFIANDEGHRLQAQGFEIELERRRVTDLVLPTGRLVACDPLTFPESEPFDVEVGPGSFPVFLTVAHMRDQKHVAYVSVEFTPERATRWEVARVDGEAPVAWQDAVRAGFPVESGVGSLMDAAVADRVLDLIHTEEGEDDFSRTVYRSLSRARRGGSFGATDIFFGRDANMVVFDLDDGVYTTYFGSTPGGLLTRLVIDLGVLDLQFTPYGLRHL